MKLCLGTVQFGMDYGIAGGVRPGDDAVEQMLAFALENGINTFDTAAAYGDAEERLGRFFSGVPRNAYKLITKIRPDALDGIGEAGYESALENELEKSLERLGVSYVDGCMFHNAAYVYNKSALDALGKLEKTGMTRQTGISLYKPEEYRAISENEAMRIVQVPCNILDRRFLPLIGGTKKEIYARSAFLQGLLLMDEKDIPGYLGGAVPFIKKLDAYCKREGISRRAVLLLFLKQQRDIEKIVFGVDSIAQLKEVIESYHEIDETLNISALIEDLDGADERLVMPTLWQKGNAKP